MRLGTICGVVVLSVGGCVDQLPSVELSGDASQRWRPLSDGGSAIDDLGANDLGHSEEDGGLQADSSNNDDVTPPQTTIVAGPPSRLGRGDASFRFEANEPAQFECSLDSGPFHTCEAKVTFNNLKPGQHTVRVRAIDDAGNVEIVPQAYSWEAIPPLLLYTFDGNVFNSGALRGAHDGTALDLRFVPGKFGQAALGPTTIPDTVWPLSQHDEYTIGLWFGCDSLTEQPTVQRLIDTLSAYDGAGGTEAGGLRAELISSNKLQVCRATSGDVTLCFQFEVLSGSSNEMDWHHLILRYGRNSANGTELAALAVYLDGRYMGVMDNGDGYPIFSTSQATDMRVGDAAVRIDELEVFSGVFSDAEQCAFVLGGFWDNDNGCKLP